MEQQKIAKIAKKICCKDCGGFCTKKYGKYCQHYKDSVATANEVLKGQWVSVKDEPIPQGPFVLAYHPKWVDDDFNKQGVRIGFQSDNGFISAYWWDTQDDFIAIVKSNWESDEANKAFFEDHLDNSEPTHWMIIPELPYIEDNTLEEEWEKVKVGKSLFGNGEGLEVRSFVSDLPEGCLKPESVSECGGGLIEKAVGWFKDIDDLCKRLTTGNVSHLGATIRGKAIRSAEFLEKHKDK